MDQQGPQIEAEVEGVLDEEVPCNLQLNKLMLLLHKQLLLFSTTKISCSLMNVAAVT